MSKVKSHVCMDKLNKVPYGSPFEYKDVVMDSFPHGERTEDGKIFKEEVEEGKFKDVVIEKDTGSHLLYRKI